jgi:hypothetical protein
MKTKIIFILGSLFLFASCVKEEEKYACNGCESYKGRIVNEKTMQGIVANIDVMEVTGSFLTFENLKGTLGSVQDGSFYSEIPLNSKTANIKFYYKFSNGTKAEVHGVKDPSTDTWLFKINL